MKSHPLSFSAMTGALALAASLICAGALAPQAAVAQEEPAVAETPASEAEAAPGEEGEAAAMTDAMEGTGEMAGAAPEGPMADGPVQEFENPYGLSALWAQGDAVAKGTLVILVLMSIGSWYVIFTKLFEQRRLFDQFNRVIKLFAPTDTLEEGIKALPERNSFRVIAVDGAEAVEQFEKGLGSDVTLADWAAASLNRSIDQLSSKLQGGLSFLATVGSTAPFIGLFGTVWGIYHALVAIGMSGQASIDKVAGPVGEALIMTAIGLAVAVPAVLGYNLLNRRNKAALDKARRFGTEVHLRILRGKTFGMMQAAD